VKFLYLTNNLETWLRGGVTHYDGPHAACSLYTPGIVRWVYTKHDFPLFYTTNTSRLKSGELRKTYFRIDCVWNVMSHAQKPDFVFRRNGRIHLNRRGRQFSRLLAAEVCASAVVMLDTPCSEEMWRVLATYSIRQFPLHFHSRASPCAITFQLESTTLASANPRLSDSGAESWTKLTRCDSVRSGIGKSKVSVELCLL